MEFDVIAQATDNFSEDNRIGKGGFGIVYKGRLPDGQEIAVKRLSELSLEGIQGFDNEVSLIAVLQHVNLVRLIGYSSNEQEKILVYEFLENFSLDTYLFGTSRSSILNWDQRFEIINGIARGILYLHQDSRFKIIHLDLKPGNVLLGKDLIPKISDFGLAHIFRGDETEATAPKARGTIGYMAPEVMLFRLISAKADIYSFGVMLLEIVSGQRNREFARHNEGESLLNFMWKRWSEGKGLEAIDPAIKDTPSPQQAARCIQIGLLCIQEKPEDRPTMASVVFMLGQTNDGVSGPQLDVPKSPTSSFTDKGESSTTRTGTINQVTLSTVDPR